MRLVSALDSPHDLVSEHAAPDQAPDAHQRSLEADDLASTVKDVDAVFEAANEAPAPVEKVEPDASELAIEEGTPIAAASDFSS